MASAQPAAREAVDLFCHRIVREIGSLAAAIGGLDALVSTGGIGEHAAPVLGKSAPRSAGWASCLDQAANAAHARRVATADPRSRCWCCRPTRNGSSPPHGGDDRTI
ncbi:MAG: hypothetical protein IPG52_15745 [Rhodocyclaceae bacterium]|nr:hypothetical protein [Rhodocyclaceae bacterium]